MAYEEEVYSESTFSFTFKELYDAFNKLMLDYKTLEKKVKEMKLVNQTLTEKADHMNKEKEDIAKQNQKLK